MNTTNEDLRVAREVIQTSNNTPDAYSLLCACESTFCEHWQQEITVLIASALANEREKAAKRTDVEDARVELRAIFPFWHEVVFSGALVKISGKRYFDSRAERFVEPTLTEAMAAIREWKDKQ